MNKQTAVKLLKQHFSLADIQSWMGECSFVDRVAIEIYKELVAKSETLEPSTPVPGLNITTGRAFSTLAYEWARDFVMAKLRFDNKDREDLRPYKQAYDLLEKLVKLKEIKTDIENGTATPEQEEFYAQTKDATWLEARRLIDG